MGLMPLPPCLRAVDESLLSDSWNNSHKRWVQATVWSAQHAAFDAEETKTSLHGLQRCAACAAEIAAASRPVCSKCKMVYFCDTKCQRAAFPVHKQFCQTPEARKLVVKDRPVDRANLALEKTKLAAILKDTNEEAAKKYRAAYAAIWLARLHVHEGSIAQAWDPLQQALKLGRQLKDWTVQSLAYTALVTSCVTMGGPGTSGRNVQCWDEALTLAKKHHDIFLEGMATKCIGGVAKQYGEFSALEESRQCWVALMKASRMRGPAGEPGLRMCASNLSITLTSIATGRAEQQKTDEAETLLREALLLSDTAGHDMPALEDQFGVLQTLANMCQMQRAAIEQNATGQQWRNKAAIYRQHAMALLKRMGGSVPSKCTICHKALHADKAMDPMNPLTAVLVQECGHIFHTVCQLTWRGKPGEQCPSCAVRGKLEK